MRNPLAEALQEAREYFKNKPNKYQNLTPEQLNEMEEHMEGHIPIDKEETESQGQAPKS